MTDETTDLVARVRDVLDRRKGLFTAINGARTFDDYLSRGTSHEDEESLTEPLLADFLERVLDFPPDAYFEQLSRSGLKPDFTPVDLVAHRFVLDAKSSGQRDLDAHEPQIRAYIDQRRLDYGVLFNLRELRVYRRGATGHVPELSFALLPVWKVARGEALASVEVERLAAFVELFRHREMDLAARITRIRRARRWSVVEAEGEAPTIDLEYLVDRLRGLSRTLADDAAAQSEQLDRFLEFNPGIEQALVGELQTLALELAPGTQEDDLPTFVNGFRAEEGLPSRAWRQYLLRVSQLALTRILLYRSWEDAGFVDERLYNGGFGDLYDRMGQRLQDVLREAFSAGRERYPWLFGSDNTYDWYRPRDEALVDVLYALTPVPLGKLDADVLGGLYESYVDEIDRDRLGQFYTPRAVVRFMWDRLGFSGPDEVFRIEGDARRPRKILDFATGSGGFLVEAARRIVDEVGDGDARAVDEGLAAIVRGLHGCEISPFPYYLTEVNLLLQVSRLLGRLRALDVAAPSFVLGVVHTDTLSTRSGADDSFAEMTPEQRADQAQLQRDGRFGLVPLDKEKADAFARMREPGAFDFVVGNPPYVFESNNKILFDRLRRLPGWRTTYRGKSDYLYYFLLLAAERVVPGGRLAVITPAGWMNAGNADWLRERLAGSLRLDELFLFGSHRLFAPEREHRRERRRAPTPTVESAILVATKGDVPAGHRLKVVALEDERAAARLLGGGAATRAPDRDALLEEMRRRATAGRGGRHGGIYVHGVRQDRLRHDEPWPVKFGERDLATRVVAHLDAVGALDDAQVEALGERWNVFQGIQTGADAYTSRIDKRLTADARKRLEADGVRIGDPILELPFGAETQAPWSEVPELLARSPESRALLYGAIDGEDATSLVWIDRGDAVPRAVLDRLERFKPLLATRAEIARNTKRQWYETAWPRDKRQMQAPKVIALYRTHRGRFALDETGDWQPSIKTTICTAKHDGQSVAYLCGLLNSELLDLWFAVRGKTPRDIWRNYEPKAMRRIPYRRVGLLAQPTDRLLALDAAVADQDTELVTALAGEIAQALREDTAVGGEAAGALERVVRAIAANRTTLLTLRAIAPALRRVVKDPWSTGPVAVDDAALVATLPPDAVISVRLDPTLAVEGAGDDRLGRPQLQAGRLELVHRRLVTRAVEGPDGRLELLAAVAAARPAARAGDLDGMLLPVDLPGFRVRADAASAEIERLLVEGRDLVETVERLVCRLYGVDAELEDEVVARAVARVSAEAPASDDD